MQVNAFSSGFKDERWQYINHYTLKALSVPLDSRLRGNDVVRNHGNDVVRNRGNDGLEIIKALQSNLLDVKRIRVEHLWRGEVREAR